MKEFFTKMNLRNLILRKKKRKINTENNDISHQKLNQGQLQKFLTSLKSIN